MPGKFYFQAKMQGAQDVRSGTLGLPDFVDFTLKDKDDNAIRKNNTPETFTIAVTAKGYTPAKVSVNTEDFEQTGGAWRWSETIRLSRAPTAR